MMTMYKKYGKIATFLTALAAAVLVMAPFASPAALYAQSNSRSDGIENGLTLVVDKVREEVADLVEDANDDNDVEDDYDDLVEEVTDDEGIEDDIQNSLDEAGRIIDGTLTNDVQDVSDVLTEFADNEEVVEPEDLPDNITSSSASAAVGSVSAEEVAEELTIDTITNEVLDNNPGLVDDVQSITNDFISESLSQPDADLPDLLDDVQSDIEDAVDDHVDESEVEDLISDLSSDTVVDAIDNGDVSIDAAVTKAILRELEEPDQDAAAQDNTETAAAPEADLEQQIKDLQKKVFQLNAIIDSLTGGNQTESSTTNPMG